MNQVPEHLPRLPESKLHSSDLKALRTVLSKHIGMADLQLIVADLELQASVNTSGTLEQSWQFLLQASCKQGGEHLKRVLDLSVERAPVLKRDPLIAFYLSLEPANVEASATQPPNNAGNGELGPNRNIAKEDSPRATWAFVFGTIFITGILIIAMALDHPTVSQMFVIRVVLALAAAGIAAMIPGFLNLQLGNWLKAGGALAVFALIYTVNPAPLDAPNAPSSHRLSVTVLDPDHHPASGAVLSSTAGTVLERQSGMYEVEIPLQSLADNQRVELFAKRGSDFLSASSTIEIDPQKERSSVNLVLTKVLAPPMTGRVVGPDGSALLGVRIRNVEKPHMVVRTDTDGLFKLPAQAADGETLRLRMEKKGFEPLEDYFRAGEAIDVRLRMKQQPESANGNLGKASSVKIEAIQGSVGVEAKDVEANSGELIVTSKDNSTGIRAAGTVDLKSNKTSIEAQNGSKGVVGEHVFLGGQ